MSNQRPTNPNRRVTINTDQNTTHTVDATNVYDRSYGNNNLFSPSNSTIPQGQSLQITNNQPFIPGNTGGLQLVPGPVNNTRPANINMQQNNNQIRDTGGVQLVPGTANSNRPANNNQGNTQTRRDYGGVTLETQPRSTMNRNTNSNPFSPSGNTLPNGTPRSNTANLFSPSGNTLPTGTPRSNPTNPFAMTGNTLPIGTPRSNPTNPFAMTGNTLPIAPIDPNRGNTNPFAISPGMRVDTRSMEQEQRDNERLFLTNNPNRNPINHMLQNPFYVPPPGLIPNNTVVPMLRAPVQGQANANPTNFGFTREQSNAEASRILLGDNPFQTGNNTRNLQQAANSTPSNARNPAFNPNRQFTYDELTQINRNVNQALYRENGRTLNGYQNPADDPQQARIHQRHNVPIGRSAWHEAPGALNHVPTPPRPMGDTTGHSLFNPPPNQNNQGPNYQNPRGGRRSIKKRKGRKSKTIRRKY